MKFTFLGAAGEVTGSQHLIETTRLRLLLDCGLFQGRRLESFARNSEFPSDPGGIDGVILSHAHIDHCGKLPGLYRAGFRGPVFCTAATADVAEIMLSDSALLQQEDARYLGRHAAAASNPVVQNPLNHRHRAGGGSTGDAATGVFAPLFGLDDVKAVVKLFQPLNYDEWHELSPQLRLRFSDAGHVLGAAIVELEVWERAETRRVVFTGDLGRRGMPLLRDPAAVPGCDVLITESTYGDRVHPSLDETQSELARIIRRAADEEGKVVIPAFSLGRTQQLVYQLQQLVRRGDIPPIPMFVDSPMSRRVTSVYRRHRELWNANLREACGDSDPLSFPELTLVESQKDSLRLNGFNAGCVIVSASGMCEGGRILHHLKHAVADERNTIVLLGYQAENTLGRRIQDRWPTLRILDREYPLRAQVESLSGLSAHADAVEFKWWFERLASQTGVGQAFIVHGENKASTSLAGILRDYCDDEPIIPRRNESFEV